MLKHLVHHHVWQRLPYGLRRSALFWGTSVLAPRPTRGATAQLPIIVAGCLRAATGLGQSARLCYQALAAEGLPVFGLDLSRAFMQPVDLPEFEFRDGAGLEGPGTLIVHVNGPLMALAMLTIGRRMVRHKRIVGYWAWELPLAPPEWVAGASFVHEIWVPSRFTAQSLAHAAQGRPVHLVPHPMVCHTVDADRPGLQPIGRQPDHPFTVLTLFDMTSSFARKNPCAAIAAFRRAFGNDPSARLILKYINSGAFPQAERVLDEAVAGATNITRITQTMEAAQLDHLYRSADVLLSLHRSEGFGLSMAEGMARGLAVVATDWSGSTDFVGVDACVPVGFKLIPAVDPQGTYDFPGMAWADADVELAAVALEALRDDPSRRRRLAQAAVDKAVRLWSTPVYRRRVAELLGI